MLPRNMHVCKEYLYRYTTLDIVSFQTHTYLLRTYIHGYIQVPHTVCQIMAYLVGAHLLPLYALRVRLSTSPNKMHYASASIAVYTPYTRLFED